MTASEGREGPATTRSIRRRTGLLQSSVGRILIAFALGIAYGAGVGTVGPGVESAGKAVIDLVKALATPLVFFAVVDSVLRTDIRASSALRMIRIASTNAIIALGIGLSLSNAFQPGRLFHPVGPTDQGALRAVEAGGRRLDFAGELIGYIPKNLVRPFLENSLISIVLIAVFVGLALRRVRVEQAARGEVDDGVVPRLIATGYRAVEVILGWIVLLLPLAVFAAVASAVGVRGLRVFAGLAAYVGVALLGMGLQVFVVYQAWIALGTRMSLRAFWAGAREPVVYALGVGSSLATLPVTLRSLERMGVSARAARLAACIGTNLNNDGILLYEAMAVMFVAQAAGLTLSIDRQFIAILACLITGVGISGIPDAGFISLAIVLATVGLPLDLLPSMLAVDWLVGRCRAATNVLSDILIAVLLDQGESGGTLTQMKNDPDGI